MKREEILKMLIDWNFWGNWKDISYIREEYISRLERFIKKGEDENHYVVLDEVQEVTGWEKFARFLSEAKKVNLFVTGSSSKLLSEEYSTLLSGRHIDLNVFPLSFKEFLKFNNVEVKNKIDAEKMRHKIKFLLKEYIEYGGFPKVVLVEKEEKKTILKLIL